MTAPGPGRRTEDVSPWWRAGHIVALSGLAVTQPVLAVLGDNPTFFVAHGAGPGAILVVVLLAVVVVPAVLFAVEGLVGLVHPTWAWPAHLVVIGLLAGLIGAAVVDDLVGTVLDDLPLVSGPLTLVLAGAVGVGFARAYARHQLLRTTVSYLVAVPVLFAAAFAFASPANDLLFPAEVEAAEVRSDGPRPPVVVVVFDELPLASVLTADGDAIDAQRFPNLARLAGDGLWYPDATSVAGFTHEAVPAILTGREVHDDNLPPTPSGHPDSLFTLLAEEYDVTAEEPLTGLCAASICDQSSTTDTDPPFDVLLEDVAVVTGRVTLPAALDDWLPTIDDTWADFGHDAIDLDQEADRLARDREDVVDELGASDRVGDFRAAVAELEDSDRPQLTFLHAVFPHLPWSYHGDGTVYADPGNPGLEENVWTSPEAADRGLQRHLLQAEYADRLLGELLDRLDALGQYDESLVVFAADHGVSFTPGTHRRQPEAASLAGIMSVPLVIKPPAGGPVRSGVDHRGAQTVDVVPTIADLLDLAIPWEVDGRSLLGPRAEAGERTIYAKGERESTTDHPLDVQPLVDHVWARFGAGDRLELYGLGAGADRIGERVDALGVAGEGTADPCWVAEAPVEGTAGWVGGHLEADEEGPIDLAVSAGGRVAGTAPTFTDGDEDHRVFVLGDPRHWGDGDDVALWRVAGSTLVPIPTC